VKADKGSAFVHLSGGTLSAFKRVAVVLTAAACSTALVSAPASASGGGSAQVAAANNIRVLARNLNGPFEVSASNGRLYVTQSGAGRVTEINRSTGHKSPVVTGLGENAASGAVRIGKKFLIVTGTSEPGDTQTPAGPQPPSSVLVAKRGHKAKQLADLLKYELKHNPDGQRQFNANGTAPDSLSNPFYILADRHRKGGVIVADGGANDVLRVSRKGKVSTFFVPPTVNTGPCKGLANNDPQHPGCDAVPTGLAYGSHNRLYVSALGSEVPGAGRVYVLNAKTGKLKYIIRGFTAPTGVAVNKSSGAVYVSELLDGLGQNQPPSATTGRIVRVAKGGKRTYAQVTQPVGLIYTGGKLYSSAWSLSGPGKGQVVRVRGGAFSSTPRE